MDEGYSLVLSTAPFPHPDFGMYGVAISSSTGLARVIATTEAIETSVNGDDLKERYNEFLKALESKYGSAKTHDFLRSGSTWGESNDWMMTLLRKERKLQSLWALPGVDITLEAVALTWNSGYLVIRYYFPTVSVWIREHNDRKHAAF